MNEFMINFSGVKKSFARDAPDIEAGSS